LILLGRHWLARWVAPIPEEPEPTLPREVTLVHRTLAGAAERIVEDVRTTPLRAERTVGLGVAAVAVLAGAKLLLVDEWGPSIFWWNLLFLVPVVWVTQRLRIAGGLVLVGVAAVGLLGTDAVLAPPGRLPPTAALVEFGQLLVLWLMAALVGRGARREGELLVALAESHERIQQDLHRVIRALTGALEAKDEYTGGHIHRVNAYALETGRRLGLSPRELELLQIGSTLHDIGKIGIPESILQKPGPLDDEEWRVMRRHPEIGARILTGVEGLSEVAPIILHHQERWDGRLGGPFPGYPAGLKGEKIPLGARIIAVVDTFDAMTTDRPYRDALSLEEARQELQREKGRQFDPEVVDRFLEVLRESPWE
jgi:HD-GYP domain-containing protein (c-di-GMP phosphodiesterase class II)